MSDGVATANVRPHRDRPDDRMPCLDGLRGLAALMVLLGHASDFGLPTFVDGSASHAGVLIFFALSGFLMGDLYLVTSATGSRVAAYGIARTARIVPIYYLVVFAAFLIHRVDPGFVYDVTVLQFCRLLTFNGSVSVFWSIGPEVQFYAVFVGLWLLRDRLRHDVIFAALVLAMSAVTLATIRHWPGILVLSKLHIFTSGLLLALLRHHTRLWLARIVPLLHAVGFAVIAIFLIPGATNALFGPTPFDRAADPGFASFYGSLPRVVLAAGLSLAFSSSSRIASALLANPLALRLGQCSFSIYLLHVAIFDLATRSGAASFLPPGAATIAVTLVTFVLALVSQALIETPSRDIVRRVLQPIASDFISRPQLRRHKA